MAIRGKRCIGVFMNWPESGPYQKDFLKGVHQAAEASDTHVLAFGLGNLQPDPRRDYPGSMFLDLLHKGPLDAAILLTGSFAQEAGDARKQALLESPLPLVSVGDVLEGVPSIVLDNMAGFAEVMEHLFGHHGYRNPVFVAGPPTSWDSNDRLRVFRQALGRFGIEDHPGRVYYGDFTYDAGRKAVEHYWSGTLVPDVIVCANDNMAIGVRRALLRCPGSPRIPVTGFDASEISDWLPSPITSVRQPLERTGREAFDLVLDLLGGRTPLPMVRYVPTIAVLSTSCGCAPKVDQTPDPERVENEVLEALVNQEEQKVNTNRLGEFAREYLVDQNLGGHPESERDIVDRLGVSFLQVSLLDHPEDGLRGESRLHISWNERTRADITPDGVPFASSLLFAPGYEPTNRKTLLVTVLAEIGSRFGYHIMDYGVSSVGLDRFGVSLSESLLAVMMNRRLERLNAELRSARAQLETLSVTDELTGHLNRRGFLLTAERLAGYCRRQGQSFCVLFLDLDGLKAINDTYGHEDGDLAIRSLGEVLRQSFRATDVVGRLGGDEFTVLAADSSHAGLSTLRQRIEALVDERNEMLERPWKLGVSVGAYVSEPDDKAALSAMMELADKALYLEKRAKKGR